MQPVTETPEVRQAREEHERLWKEAARLNGVDPDRNDLYNPNADRLADSSDDDENEEDLDGQVSNQHQSLTRYPVLPYNEHIAPGNAKGFGKVVEDSVIVEPKINEARARFARQQQDEAEEVTSEPRGFFYSFDYPVPFIVDHKAKSKQVEESEAQASENLERLIDVRIDGNDIGTGAPTTTTPAPKEVQVQKVEAIKRAPSESEKIRDGYAPPEEVHDAQVSPKQKRTRGSVRFHSI